MQRAIGYWSSYSFNVCRIQRRITLNGPMRGIGPRVLDFDGEAFWIQTVPRDTRIEIRVLDNGPHDIPVVVECVKR